MLTGVLLANGTLNASTLNSLYNENLVKGVSAALVVKLFKSWINEKDINAVAPSLWKVSMDNRLMELFPANKQSIEHFTKYFTEAGLKELSEYVWNQQTTGARKELQKELQEQMSRGDPFKDKILYVKEEMKKKQHPRTSCHRNSMVQCNEHRGMEQKRGACSRASHQALEAIQPSPCCLYNSRSV